MDLQCPGSGDYSFIRESEDIYSYIDGILQVFCFFPLGEGFVLPANVWPLLVRCLFEYGDQGWPLLDCSSIDNLCWAFEQFGYDSPVISWMFHKEVTLGTSFLA
uniref:Uncharacterized protein n=1 Tax=Opuntia streptacantha TaxID=393608 RepID=A0A7C9EFS3_OPUST